MGDNIGEAMEKVSNDVMAGHHDWLYEGVVPLTDQVDASSRSR